jgi:hypothetical protein
VLIAFDDGRWGADREHPATIRRRCQDGVMSSIGEWDRRTAKMLEEAYLAARTGPRGSGSGSSSEGDWRAKRQHLATPMDADGPWLDVGCANGHLLATLPSWAAERGLRIVPHGLELLPRLTDLARSLHPALADRIWTGSVMSWLHRMARSTSIDRAVIRSSRPGSTQPEAPVDSDLPCRSVGTGYGRHRCLTTPRLYVRSGRLARER